LIPWKRESEMAIVIKKVARKCIHQKGVRKCIRLYRRLYKRIDPFTGEKGQDKWVIFTALPFKRKGFFLDLGAADGITNSNTYILEKFFRWNGICIEPNPIFLQQLKETRNCIIDGSVISDRHEKVSFRIDNKQLGGIIAEDTDNSMRVRADQLSNAEIITLNAVTLTELLDRYNAPKVIDYFSLDVEGSEERVIRSFDFDRYRFECLTIERPTPEVNEILFENGYVFVKNYWFDSFYVHSSLADKRKIHCQPFEQVPAKDW
jgi:FkbM family methyltransferase